ncbi:MAG: transporter substrate-binding domain-containing protein [Clostridiales bacterium]|nr:transporter substrate-binding domain-containing protein [Clostridiales bacterium]
MKKVFALALALVLALGLMLIPSHAEDKDLLARIQESGKMVVAMEGVWKPWTYHDDDDVLMGFDVEVAKAVAEKLGVEAVFEECPWDSIFAGVDAGRYDIVFNGVDYTEERAGKFAFSTPYAYNYAVLIVRADEEGIASFEDLDGKKSANTMSSTYAELAESYGATNVGIDDFDMTIELLITKRVDATINAEVSYIDYMTARPDAPIKIAAKYNSATSVCAVMPKGADSESFVAAVNAALDELNSEGVISALSVKYFFGSDLTIAPAAAE